MVGEVFGATALTWTSRYLVVNALFLGFVPAANQLVVFARQFVVWVVLMVSPYPRRQWESSEWLLPSITEICSAMPLSRQSSLSSGV